MWLVKKEIGPRIYMYIYDTHYHTHRRCAFNLGDDEESSLGMMVVHELCMMLCWISERPSIRREK